MKILKKLHFFLFANCLVLGLNGQIVTIEPPFFDQNSDITVTYDATQGNAGLLGVFPVYMHAGLIIEGEDGWQYVQGNWGTDDPKVKMTYTGNNKHVKSYNIKDFHGLPDTGVEVKQLAFVFRNVNGSKEGKTSELGDIFIDLPDISSFSGYFVTPDQNFLIEEVGNTIDIQVVVSEPSNIFLYDNDNLITENFGIRLDYTLEVTGPGFHSVKFEANNGDTTILDSFAFIVNEELVVEELPEGTEMGLNRLSDSHVRLALYAPDKDYVYAIGNFSNWVPRVDYFMKNTPDGNVWWVDIHNLEGDTDYFYKYIIDGQIQIADPLSELILDEQNDGFIPEETFPNLPEFPSDFTSGRISYFQTNPEEFEWQVTDFVPPPKEELIIYELLMRDFTDAKNYQTLTDTLDYLQRLGINAIELMPINEFEGNQSWGYNPSYHMALDKAYGTPEAFKTFVDEAHARGMAVILDVVYNHAFGQCPLVRMYWNSQLNRPSEDSPYFNPEAKHPFNVGYDFNHESNATKNYVKRVMKYWIEEYRVDGFRFDLSKGFTQTFNTNINLWSNYDASRIAILKEYADFVWSLDPDFYVILEHFAQNSEEIELSNYGAMLWSNGNHTMGEAILGFHGGGASNFSWFYYKNRGFDLPHSIAYMESHDEERQVYKAVLFGNGTGNYLIKDLETALDRIEMAATLYFTIPGPKMIWQFGELGYDQSINRCENGGISEDCRLSPKPVLWEYFEDENRKDVYLSFSKLAHIKKTEDLFNTDEVEMSVAGPVKYVKLIGNGEAAIAVGNFDITTRSVSPGFTQTGTWYDYMSGDSITITDVNQSLNLQAGEYHLYLDKKVDFTSSTPFEELDFNSFVIYPNPAEAKVNIDFTLEGHSEMNIQLVNVMGETIYSSRVNFNSGNNHYSLDLDNVIPGLYFIQISNSKGQLTRKLIVD